MNIQLIDNVINKSDIQKLAEEFYEEMIKGVVDLEGEVIALGGEMHADAEELLLKQGSRQQDLWGFNLLLDKTFDDAIEYQSFINIRPRDGNRTHEIENVDIRRKVKEVIKKRVAWSDE